ncbi:hypothetical protein D9M72_575830 [compost metagenome]
MTELKTTHHVDVAAGFIGQVGEQHVIDIGGFNGDGYVSRQRFEPLLDGCLVVGNCLKQIDFSAIDHQFVLGDIRTHNRLGDENLHCH